MKNTLIVLVGPTGVGKTDLSINLAQGLNCEIISADSRQLYKEMEIGTAVPNLEQLQLVKHHFIANKTIHEYYNASMYEFEVLDLLNSLFVYQNTALMVGGSGMYIDAVCYGIDDLPTIDSELREDLLEKFKTEGINGIRLELKRLDPEYYKQVDLKNPKRILKAIEVSLMTGKPYSTLLTRSKRRRHFDIVKIGLNIERELLYQRINHRVDLMLEQGLIDEVRRLYPYKNLNALNTVGYKEFFAHFDGQYDMEKAIELLKRNTRHYAKRQLSWFNRDKTITWFNPAEREKIFNFITT